MSDKKESENNYCDKKSKAEALLNAQVDFILAELQSDRFLEIVNDELDHFFSLSQQLKLNAVVTPEKIKITAQKYLVDLPMPPINDETFTQLATFIYTMRSHQEHTLGDILSDQQFQDWLEKFIEMDTLRESVIDEFVNNQIYTAMVSDILYSAIKGFALDNNALVKAIPGASAMMKLGKNVVSRTAPKLEKATEDAIKKYIHSNLKSTLKQSKSFLSQSLDKEKITETATDMWSTTKQQQLDFFKKYISKLDMQEFLVLTQDFWMQYRETGYFSELINESVDFIFEQYGHSTLKELLDMVGVDKSKLCEDAQRFAPHIIDILHQNGYSKEFYRRRLAPFFYADSTLAIL